MVKYEDLLSLTSQLLNRRPYPPPAHHGDGIEDYGWCDYCQEHTLMNEQGDGNGDWTFRCEECSFYVDANERLCRHERGTQS